MNERSREPTKPVFVETKTPVDSQPHAAGRRSLPGAGGGVKQFAPGVDVQYSLAFRGPGADARLRMHLDVAALIRRAFPSQDDTLPGNPERFGSPPAGAGQGSGGSVGPHYLYCDRENQWLWLDGQQLVSLNGTNIVLLAEASGTLTVAGTDNVDGDLGEAPLLAPRGSSALRSAAEASRWLQHVQQQLRNAIARSSAARNFLAT